MFSVFFLIVHLVYTSAVTKWELFTCLAVWKLNNKTIVFLREKQSYDWIGLKKYDQKKWYVFYYNKKVLNDNDAILYENTDITQKIVTTYTTGIDTSM